jgi:hypothetical protein
MVAINQPKVALEAEGEVKRGRRTGGLEIINYAYSRSRFHYTMLLPLITWAGREANDAIVHHGSTR